MTRLLILAALALVLAPVAASAQTAASPYTSGTRYDAAGRVTGTIAPGIQGVSAFIYPAVRNTYDQAGRLIRIETGELTAWQSEAVAPASWGGFTVLRTAQTSYDAMSRKVRESVREGAGGPVRSLTQYGYDPAGRLECTAVRMNEAQFGGTLPGACTQAAGAVPDRITRTIYDAAGQRLQLREGVGTAAEAAEATWAYNANGQVTTVIDGNGNRAELRYDGHGRQDRWTFPSATPPGSRPTPFDDSTQATAINTAGSVNAADYEEYGYDANGNRTSLRKRDGASAAYTSGNTLIYRYDALNRMTEKLVPERSDLNAAQTRDVYYSYDVRGLQLSARFDSQSGEGVTNTYDGFGRLASTSTNMGGTSFTLTYDYDANNNRTRITHPGSQAFTYIYDGLNRLTGIDEGTGSGSTMLGRFTYNDYGQLRTRDEAGGSAALFGHDEIGRLDSLYGFFSGGSGNVVSYFAFNPANQIVSQTRDNDAYAWNGHYAVSRAYATNGLNQYDTVGSSTYDFDAKGNLTASVGVAADYYTYDVENRLVSASGDHNATLSYDPIGRLWQISGASTTTRFLYDGDALVGEYNGSNAMTRRYVHGGDAGADDPLVWYQIGDTTPRRWLHADERGSIVAMTNGSGQAIGINTYDEYGIPHPVNNGRFQYTGQAWLPELGMYYYKARIYSPTLGRFLQTDPIGYADQFNLYEYVGDDPVNHTDPSGRCIEDLCIGEAFIVLEVLGYAAEAIEAAGATEAVVAGAQSTLAVAGTVAAAQRAARAQRMLVSSTNGARREREVATALAREHPSARVQNQSMLRDSHGRSVRDPQTGMRRRVDHAVIENGRARTVETTSLTARKTNQIEREQRIRDAGGTHIRDRQTNTLCAVAGVSEVRRCR